MTACTSCKLWMHVTRRHKSHEVLQNIHTFHKPKGKECQLEERSTQKKQSGINHTREGICRGRQPAGKQEEGKWRSKGKKCWEAGEGPQHHHDISDLVGSTNHPRHLRTTPGPTGRRKPLGGHNRGTQEDRGRWTIHSVKGGNGVCSARGGTGRGRRQGRSRGRESRTHSTCGTGWGCNHIQAVKS
jgi:hypothetical protein